MHGPTPLCKDGVCGALTAAWLLAEKDPPKKVPTVREVIRRIAMLGGFLGRKGDGEPGVKTLWQGYARVTSFVRGVEKMGTNHAL